MKHRRNSVKALKIKMAIRLVVAISLLIFVSTIGISKYKKDLNEPQIITTYEEYYESAIKGKFIKFEIKREHLYDLGIRYSVKENKGKVISPRKHFYYLLTGLNEYILPIHVSEKDYEQLLSDQSKVVQLTGRLERIRNTHHDRIMRALIREGALTASREDEEILERYQLNIKTPLQDSIFFFGCGMFLFFVIIGTLIESLIKIKKAKVLEQLNSSNPNADQGFTSQGDIPFGEPKPLYTKKQIGIALYIVFTIVCIGVMKYKAHTAEENQAFIETYEQYLEQTKEYNYIHIDIDIDRKDLGFIKKYDDKTIHYFLTAQKQDKYILVKVDEDQYKNLMAGQEETIRIDGIIESLPDYLKREMLSYFIEEGYTTHGRPLFEPYYIKPGNVKNYAFRYGMLPISVLLIYGAIVFFSKFFDSLSLRA